MALTLSWDLFIIVFFATVMAYSFIIGKTESIKVIIASYISVLATQGIGNILSRLMGESQAILEVMGLPTNVTALSIAKITFFILFIIVICTRSGIGLNYEHEPGSIMAIVYTALFGFSTAGLIVSTVMTYAMGSAILDTSLGTAAGLAELLQASPLMQIMVLNQDLWFTLPAILLVGIGFISNE